MRTPSEHPPHGVRAGPRKMTRDQQPYPGHSPDEVVSGASRRLRALAALSGSLTDALSPEEAANLVQQKALSALGATSAVVVTLGPFPPEATDPDSAPADPDSRMLNVVHAIGIPAEVKAALDRLPLDAPVPLAEVARTGEPVFLSSEEELRRYPDWGSAMIRAGSGSAAIVPVWANGELRGVLGLAWPDARTFDQDERAFVLTLGVMCAQAIMRAHLREAELTARADAEDANRSKARFVATISHELRTPMNAVLGYTDLLADEVYGPVTALQKDHLGRVRASGTHLMSLIEDLLGYARIEAGEETVRAERVLLADVVEQSLMLVRPIAEKKGLHISLEAPDEPVTLNTDARKVCQILVNLLANAVKFTEAGPIVLRVGVARADGDVTVHFEVSDTGRGIPLEDQEHIFEPFWQSGSLKRRDTGGSGLGLSVARQLARLLGGDVTVAKSTPDGGSTFVASVPADVSKTVGAKAI